MYSFETLRRLVWLAIILAIIVTAGNWKIFLKAGRPGWAVLIPFYRTYIASNIAFGNLNYFIVNTALWAVTFVGSFYGILALFARLVSLAVSIVYYVKLSKAFGKSGGFVVGMVLLPPIFIAILGFNRDEYIGPQNFKTQDKTFYET